MRVRLLSLVFSAAALAGAAVGCSGSPDGTAPGAPTKPNGAGVDGGAEPAAASACTTNEECTAVAEGTVCSAEGACVVGCNDASCGPDAICDSASGQCLGAATVDPGTGPIPACADLPERDCKADCGKIMPFEPVKGRGYDNYPLNGETLADQYRSFARRDLAMLVKYAAAYVDCKAKAWKGGNNKPLGLGDMSESNGAIPGTREKDPGHPEGTHVNGFDMDIGYYQTKGKDNYLRPICPHADSTGKEQYHCTAAPDNLDGYRTALYLGAFLSSDRMRIIGVDGQVGPIVEKILPELCKGGWLPQKSCTQFTKGLVTYETKDEGRGWFMFHHHHFHVSMSNKPYPTSTSPLPEARSLSIAPDGADRSTQIFQLGRSLTPGHAHVVDTQGAAR